MSATFIVLVRETIVLFSLPSMSIVIVVLLVIGDVVTMWR